MPLPDPPRCSNCLFFLALPPSDQEGKGLCRHGPPRQVNNHVEPRTNDGRWPLCFENEWCGEWKKII